MNLSFWRTPNYGFTRLLNHVILAVLTGLMYLQLDDSRSSLQYRVFIIFQVTVLPALILAQVEPKYAMARMVAYREQSSKAYKELPFAIAIVIAEMPYSVLCAVCFFLPIYYIPGLSSETFRAGYQFFMVLITELFSVTLGQMIAALTPDPFISSLVNPFVIVIFALFCGVTIPKPAMPGFWRAWLYELDPFTRLIGGMIVTELHDRPVECTSLEYNRFTAPDGQDCGSYMADFFSNGAPGYILDNATSMCEYCAYKVGDQFYEPLGYEYGNRWRDLGIFMAFIGSNLIILLLAVSLLRILCLWMDTNVAYRLATSISIVARRITSCILRIKSFLILSLYVTRFMHRLSIKFCTAFSRPLASTAFSYFAMHFPFSIFHFYII
jgi:ABC-type multidrug transport system permease subunit